MIWNALGKLALGQKAANSAAAYKVTAATGSFTWNGVAALLPVVMPASAGSFAWTGTTTYLPVTMPADTGAFTLSGVAAALPVVMPADAGTFTLTGTTTYLPVTMPALAGTFTFTGNDAGTNAAYRLDAQPYVTQFARHILWSALGRVAIGQSRELVQSSTTTFRISWQDATASVAMPAEAGAFSVLSTDVQLYLSIPHAVGTYVLTGTDALLPVSMPAETGIYTTTGNVIEFRRQSRKIRGYPRTGTTIAGRSIGRGMRAVGYGG